MRIIYIGIAVLLSLVSSANNAVQLSADGTGQALLYPYYIANTRYATTLSVTNSKSVGKALKLRFQEANNGRDVAMLNIYLPPFATWTAGVFPRNDPVADISIVRANLTSFDPICTVPSADPTPRIFVGLPVIGLWLVNLENRNARPNVQGFYGGSYRHRVQRRCFSNVSTQTTCE